MMFQSYHMLKNKEYNSPIRKNFEFVDERPEYENTTFQLYNISSRTS